MTFNAEDARRYLEGIDYPATKEQIISPAESNGAPEELLDRIGTMGRPEYNQEEDLIVELRASPQGG